MFILFSFCCYVRILFSLFSVKTNAIVVDNTYQTNTYISSNYLDSSFYEVISYDEFFDVEDILYFDNGIAYNDFLNTNFYVSKLVLDDNFFLLMLIYLF